ncbi:MAG: hypothetical protein Q8R48_02025 [Candidatus Omnitrophota bacterium]|nr:hypothetical protein [Candidatus Omnitrophota bacterium]
MRRVYYATIFIAAFFLLTDFKVWAQATSQKEAEQGERTGITQGRAAELIGERFGYKEEPIIKFKQIGVTPLGEWDPVKPLTKDDVDAILIRIARRNPVAEKMEPAKLLDSIGFPPRDVSEPSVMKILESDAFEKVMINLSLFISASIMPLPQQYVVRVVEEDAGAEETRPGGAAAPGIAAGLAAPGAATSLTGAATTASLVATSITAAGPTTLLATSVIAVAPTVTATPTVTETPIFDEPAAPAPDTPTEPTHS